MPKTLRVLFLVNLLNIYDRVTISAVVEPLRREFSLSDAQIGALSTLFLLVYAAAGIPLGRLADRGSRRALLSGAVAAWSAMTALGGFARGYGLLLFSRVGVAVGEAACAPAATSWIGDAVPAERRSAAMARFMYAVPLGSALAMAAGGALAQSFGWRWALWAAGLAGVPVALLLLRSPEPPRAVSPSAGPVPVRALLALPAFRWIIASGAILNFVVYAFSTFLPAWLVRIHGLPVATTGAWMGAGYAIAGLAAAALSGSFGDRYRHARLLPAAAFALLAAPLAVAGQFVSSAAPALALWMAAYACLNTYYGMVYAAIQDLVPKQARATAMSVYFFGMYLCGAAFGPWITGGLSDALARRAAQGTAITEAARAQGLHQALFAIPLLAVALAAVLAAGARADRGHNGLEKPHDA